MGAFVLFKLDLSFFTWALHKKKPLTASLFKLLCSRTQSQIKDQAASVTNLASFSVTHYYFLQVSIASISNDSSLDLSAI